MSRTRTPKPDPARIEVQDEPGMSERFQRTLRNLLNTPPKPRKATVTKPKECATPKGRAHKEKTRS